MSSKIKLMFLGDCMCQMQQIRAVEGRHVEYDEQFEQVKPLLKGADYVVANLETPVAGKKLRYAFEEARFNAPDRFLAALKRLGVNFLSLANNHCLDRGARGADITIGKVRDYGFDATGVYLTKEDSEKVFVKNINGLKFAFISCTYETNQGRRSDLLDADMMWKVDQLAPPKPYTVTTAFEVKRFMKNLVPYRAKLLVKKILRKGICSAGESYLPDCTSADDIGKPEHVQFINRIKSKILTAKSVADFVVVLPHIGGQYNPAPGPFQKWTVDWMISTGADFVICNHAHTPLQSKNYANGAFAAYALGNFSMTPGVGYYRKGCQADYSIILTLIFDVENRRCVEKKIKVIKNIVKSNGVSVIVPCDASDKESETVIRRFKNDQNL